MTSLPVSQEEIAVRAYELFLDGGCQHGRDQEYWFQAERELGAKFFTAPQAKAPSTKKAAKKAASGDGAAVKKTPARKAAADKPASPKKTAAKK